MIQSSDEGQPSQVNTSMTQQQTQNIQAQTKPLYSFQNQFNGNQSQQQQLNESQTSQTAGTQQQQQSNMKVGYQFFMKNNSPNTTNYSSTAPAQKRISTNTGGMSDLQDQSEKMTVTDGNNMSVIQEEVVNQPQKNTFQLQKLQQPPSPAVNLPLSQTSLSPNNNTPQQKTFCTIHFDKPIEYFCSQCHQSVCSKCMFLHHNGHDLAQIEDALRVMKEKIIQFNSKVQECQKDNEETKSVLHQHKQSLDNLKSSQQSLIDKKFKELQQRLEDRKNQLTKDIIHKYETHGFKIQDKLKQQKELIDEIANIKDKYKEVMEKLNDEKFLKDDGNSEQIAILNKVADFDKFIYDNTLKLKNYQASLKNTKLEYQDGTPLALRPIDIGILNALSLIQTLVFDSQIDYSLPQPIIQPRQPSESFKGNNLFKDSPTSHQSMNQVIPQKISHKLDNSFQFPKSNQSNNQLNNINPGTSKIPMTQQILTNSQPLSIIPRSKSVQQNLQESQVNSQMGQEESKQINQQVSSSSKFARLKFQRQGTDTSQELCLQLDGTQINLNSNNQMQKIPLLKQEENKQQQHLLDDDDQRTPEEKQSNKIKLLDNAIYCIGDSRFILMFDYKNSLWQQIFFDKRESDYQGTLKFMSICQINTKKREFLMTGGCNKQTKEASSQCFRFSIPTIRNFREVSRLINPRYGHASVFINSLVLVIGGFNHRDDEAQAPFTLNSGEKYSIKENQWTPIAPMQQERAYFSACRVKEEFIYVFGGFQNYETTSSIEFYNIMLDKWTLLSITMPLKLAKYGLAKIEENQIVIVGGLLVDNCSTRSSVENTSYSCVNTVYKFDCNTLKWTKLAKLNFRRNMYSTLPVKENLQIFAIGGTLEGINEVYDIRKKKWNTCQSYTNIMGQNDLQTYAICSLSKFDE